MGVVEVKLKELKKREAKILEMGGEKAVAKQHEKDKLTARERLNLLFDEGTFREIDMFVNHRCVNFGMQNVEIPSDGVITARVAEPGEILRAGATIAVLTDIKRPWLTVWIDEPNLSRVKLNDTATVRVDGSDRDFEGTVSFVSPVAEFTPKTVETPSLRTSLVYRLRVVVENPDDGLRQGMPVTVTFPEPAPGS